MTGEYDGVVYDLDGTLVRLDVDWAAVRTDVSAVYESFSHDPSGRDLWALFEDAPDFGLTDEVEATIARHEREGARTSDRLPLADEVVSDDRPIGVCSLNCEAAARIALETHDLHEHVSVVVGRDSVELYKPHPQPLLAAIRELGLEPAGVLFVGDSERDADTAERAGTAFEWV
ncbi:HAD family hydrolase [Haloarchaeobius sp. TZWWS8]|uniref:HAD family hydrolase n=1 Tax=Haloarchaeobius sp. TZWWS8 TaxID=3446121 RepID=UPI003EB8DF45